MVSRALAPPTERDRSVNRRPTTAGGSPGLAFSFPAALFVAFVVVPIAALLWKAVASPDFWSSLTKPLVFQALRLTVVTTLLALLVSVAAGTPLAYLLSRRRTPLLRAVQLVADLPLVLPPMVAGVALLMAFGRRGVLGGALAAAGIELPFTTAAVVLAQVFVASPFYIRSAKVGFGSIDREVEEAAAMDGATFGQAFRLIVIPIAMPGLAGGAVLCLGRAISEFGATLLFAGNFEGRTQTMSLAIMQAMQTDLPAALVLSLILVVVAGAVLVVFQLIAGASVEP